MARNVQRQEDGRWSYGFRHGGRRYRRFGFETAEAAAAALARKRREVERQPAAPARVPLRQVLELYVQRTRALHADKPKTIRTVEQTRAVLLRILGATRTEFHGAGERYIERRRAEVGSAATIAKELRTLKAALRHAARRPHCLIPEVPEIPLPTVRRPRYRILTREEVGRLMDGAPPHIRTLVALCAFAGLRQDEALHLSVSDVDLEAGEVHVLAKPPWTPKDHQERSIPIAPILARELRRHLALDSGCMARRCPGDWLFQSRRAKGARLAHVGKTLDRLFARVGLEDPRIRSGTHALRRYFATDLHARGVDLETIRQLGGWSSIEVLIASYIRTNAARQRAAVARFG